METGGYFLHLKEFSQFFLNIQYSEDGGDEAKNHGLIIQCFVLGI
jgi:hypothetical protein